MLRLARTIVLCVTPLVSALVPAASWACRPVGPTGCETASVEESALHPPANAAAIRFRRSHDLSFGAGPYAEVRWLKPDGGIVLGGLSDFGSDAIYTSSEELEPGPGYVLELEEFCIDGGWNPDAGFVRTYEVEVTESIAPPPSAPAPIGTVTSGEPETVVVERSSLGSDCSTTTEQVRLARATVHFTPDPAWRDVLPRVEYEMQSDSWPRTFPMGSVGESGVDVTFEADCDDYEKLDEHAVKMLVRVPGMTPSPSGVATGTYRLECSPLPTNAGGCSAPGGAASAASVLGLGVLGLLMVRRRARGRSSP